MGGKTELEQLLRETVEQVKQEKMKKKVGNINRYMVTGPTIGDDEQELTQQERERVVELLLSQEKVIALLYEKTFPVNANQDGETI